MDGRSEWDGLDRDRDNGQRGQARRGRIIDSAPFLLSSVVWPQPRAVLGHFRSLLFCQPRFRRPREFLGTEFGGRKECAQRTTGKSHRSVHGQATTRHQATSSPPKLPATQPTNSSHQKHNPPIPGSLILRHADIDRSPVDQLANRMAVPGPDSLDEQ